MRLSKLPDVKCLNTLKLPYVKLNQNEMSKQTGRLERSSNSWGRKCRRNTQFFVCSQNILILMILSNNHSKQKNPRSHLLLMVLMSA